MTYFITKGRGFFHITIFAVVLVLIVAGFVVWSNIFNQQDGTKPSVVHETKPKKVVVDNPSTIDNPQKIATQDEKQYFFYGEPVGQNNANPKKIIITLHGTGGTAEKDYEIWKPFVKETSYALASLNWWDGSGETVADYSTPDTIVSELHSFLQSQGYKPSDIVVLEGFSRGSANSYPIAALDQAGKSPYLDVVISSSGGAQPDYYLSTTGSINSHQQSNIFSHLSWILACGGKDKNTARDGCIGMKSARQFVADKGARVLGLLEDPNGGHGALTTSSLNLAKQAFDLIENSY